MQYVDPLILDAASSRDALTPCAFIDVYTDIAARVAIDSNSQWTGGADPMKASDSNISFIRIIGAITLADGASVAPASGGTDVLEATLAMAGHVNAHWHTAGNAFTGRRTVHDYFDKIIDSQTPDYFRTFTAGATSILNSIIVRAAQSGYATRLCNVRIYDSNGNQVGSTGSFTPSGAAASYTVTGISASLSKGRQYTLSVGFKTFAGADLPNQQFVPRTNYGYSLSIYGYTVASSTWRIDGANGAFSTGGNEGYQASGSLTRQFDMGVLPSTDGVVSFIDSVPSGSTQIVTMYFTDSDLFALETNLINWTSFGVVDSGAVISAHKYWRASIAFTSNTANDVSPVISKMEVTYKESPITVGTAVEEGIIINPQGYYVPWVIPLKQDTFTETYLKGTKSLHKISTLAAQMSPKVASSMIGRMTITMTNDPVVNDMASKPLRGKLVVVRVGFIINGVPVTSDFYKGIVSDLAWNGKNYTLTIQDDLDIVDVKIPREKAGSVWSSVTAYSIGDIVVFGTKSYSALTANTNKQPDTNPTDWSDNGTVWTDIVYSTITSPDAGLDWHLADIYKDLLLNHVNIPTQRFNLQAIIDVKAAYPNMRGNRTITKPISAIQLLTEIAWLLRSQTSMQQGKITLTQEPTTASIERITDNDNKNRISYNRGFKNLKNECLILSGYSGDGEGDEQFLQSYAYADVTSIADYEMVGLEVFKDKWNILESELVSRATDYVNRWKDGRRLISNISVPMRLMAVEVGDVVAYNSVMLPPFDQTERDYIVVRRDIDWIGQSLKLSLLEV